VRLFYTILFYLLLPVVLLRLYWRGFKAPAYRQRWQERLGIYPHTMPHQVIWLHAVSVGEAEAAFPLIQQLQNQFPEQPFLVTTTTPTGSARVRKVLADSVSHVYLPYDLPWVINRFLTTFQPKIAIMMEKEIWPNLYAQCAGKAIPVFIINARLSKSSAAAYQKIPSLTKPALNNTHWIAAQTEEDKNRFIEIGANPQKISVTGNLKFDLAIDQTMRQKASKIRQDQFPNRFIWLIASTHKGEEAIFLDGYLALKKQIPELLLIIAPRHPERFNLVKQLAENRSLTVCLHSQQQPCDAQTDVYLLDTIGELKLFYGVADICFVGGSLVTVGGHNILEPAVMNTPIIFGPYMTNFQTIADNMLAQKAVIQCQQQDLFNTVLTLYEDGHYRKQLTSQAARFVTKSQGATQRTVELISQILQ